MKRDVWLSIAGLLGVWMLAGCATPGGDRCALWVDVYRGEPVGYAEMVGELAQAKVIYLGERHTVDRHHTLQEKIVADLVAADVPLVLGVEMLEWDRQPAVDRYNRGEISFEELAAETDWEERWSNYADYRGVIEAARAAGAPLVALNARAETVREVARKTLGKIDEQTRAELPADMLLDDPMYEQHLAQVMMVHAMKSKEMMRGMFEAQVTRDETMAARLVTFLQSAAGRGRTAVVLLGAGHCAHGMGVPTRVARRMGDVRQRIVVMSESGDVELSPMMQKMAREITITHEQLRMLDVPIADYLHVVSLAEEEE